MPPLETIALLLAAYILVAVLLLSLNVASRWRWWIKASAMVVTGAFFVVSYLGYNLLLGLPSREQVPDRFNLIATRIVEPDKLAGDPGSIYLWLELLDDNNIPSGRPLSYQIAYSDPLADAVDHAQDLLDQGSQVEATLKEVVGDEGDLEESQVLEGGQAPGAAAGGELGENVEGVSLVFNNLPPVRLPQKGPL